MSKYICKHCCKVVQELLEVVQELLEVVQELLDIRILRPAVRFERT